jgi:hypothetical protein
MMSKIDLKLMIAAMVFLALMIVYDLQPGSLPIGFGCCTPLPMPQ